MKLEGLIEQEIGLSWSEVDSTVTPKLGSDAVDLSWGEVVRARVVGVVHEVVDG